MTRAFEKKYFRNLNATRFLAFLPVFLTHCFFTNDETIKKHVLFVFVQQHLKLGLLALDYFFVLSSFLISWIIYEELSIKGEFSIKNFYIRRSLRIFPLYFVIVILGFVIQFFDRISGTFMLEALPSFHHFLFFTLNFYMMNHGLNFLFFLTFFWSVSIEEQFYVFWALVLKFISKFDVVISVLLIITSLIFRAINIHEDNRLVFHTLSSLANFGLGNLLCIAFFKYPFISQRLIDAISSNTKRIIYLVFLMICFWYNLLFSSQVMVVVERLFFALFFVFVIADLAFSAKPSINLEGVRWMNYFGQLSFGLYCYHGVLMTCAFYLLAHTSFLSSTSMVLLITPLVLLLATLLTAHVSYRFIEKPILKFKANYYSN